MAGSPFGTSCFGQRSMRTRCPPSAKPHIARMLSTSRRSPIRRRRFSHTTSKSACDLEQAARFAVRAGDDAMAINAYASARDRYLDALHGRTLHGTDAAAIEVKVAGAFDALGRGGRRREAFRSRGGRVSNGGQTCRRRRDSSCGSRRTRTGPGRAREAEDACNDVIAEAAAADVLYGAHAILAALYSATAHGPRPGAGAHRRSAGAGVEGNVRDIFSRVVGPRDDRARQGRRTCRPRAPRCSSPKRTRHRRCTRSI